MTNMVVQHHLWCNSSLKPFFSVSHQKSSHSWYRTYFNHLPMPLRLDQIPTIFWRFSLYWLFQLVQQCRCNPFKSNTWQWQKWWGDTTFGATVPIHSNQFFLLLLLGHDGKYDRAAPLLVQHSQCLLFSSLCCCLVMMTTTNMLDGTILMQQWRYHHVNPILGNDKYGKWHHLWCNSVYDFKSILPAVAWG